MAKPKIVHKCVYCGAEFRSHKLGAKYCKDSHRVNDFRRTQLSRLREFEKEAAKHGQ